MYSFSLKVKDRVFTYKQDNFIAAVETIDEGNNGVPVSLSLTGKQCVSHNPLCPQGVIYNLEHSHSLKSFNQGITDYNARYDSNDVQFIEAYDSIDFLVDYVLAKNIREVLPQTSYLLRVGQCRGEPFVSKPLSFMDGISQIFNFAPRDALWTYITTYAEFKWEANLTIAAAQEVTEYTDKELRKQQKTHNADNGLAQRRHRGWTKRPRYSIENSLEIEGTLTFNDHDYSVTLKKDFERKAKKISLLNKAVKTLDLVSITLSTTKDKSAKITLLDTEIIYPALEIKSSGELKEDTASNTIYYIERQLSLGLAPLIGMKMTLDLFQAFAAWYHADVLLAAVREGLMSQEQAYEEGHNAAFFGTKFQLVAEGKVDFTLTFVSDAENKWKWQKADTAEAKLSLTLDANVRAGVRFYIAEGALEIGGKAIAEGCLGLDDTAKDKLDLVFYHNGITAKVYVSYTAGISLNQGGTDGPRRFPGKNSTSQPINKNEQFEKEWIIHGRLEKNNSKYRFNFI
ncbi:MULTISPECIES: hypothetical protein [unclassified Brenneria]|uniref:hypothetical protein n=1 Tax=unclassified Brenneria TaxID=2634434 RepID=UPI001F486073|nr:hypothetical protein [Brenneria sp. L3-3C-1]MEE3644267.1 hypothetical protein [Brenneria sp. L3_3C_1]